MTHAYLLVRIEIIGSVVQYVGSLLARSTEGEPFPLVAFFTNIIDVSLSARFLFLCTFEHLEVDLICFPLFLSHVRLSFALVFVLFL